jgi:hypothetical protein
VSGTQADKWLDIDGLKVLARHATVTLAVLLCAFGVNVATRIFAPKTNPLADFIEQWVTSFTIGTFSIVLVVEVFSHAIRVIMRAVTGGRK